MWTDRQELLECMFEMHGFRIKDTPAVVELDNNIYDIAVSCAKEEKFDSKF